MKAKYDFRVDNHGSIVILHALTQSAKLWVAEHVNTADSYHADSYQPYKNKNALVIEPRYMAAIAEGIQGDGLTIRWPPFHFTQENETQYHAASRLFAKGGTAGVTR